MTGLTNPTTPTHPNFRTLEERDVWIEFNNDPASLTMVYEEWLYHRSPNGRVPSHVVPWVLSHRPTVPTSDEVERWERQGEQFNIFFARARGHARNEGHTIPSREEFVDSMAALFSGALDDHESGCDCTDHVNVRGIASDPERVMPSTGDDARGAGASGGVVLDFSRQDAGESARRVDSKTGRTVGQNQTAAQPSAQDGADLPTALGAFLDDDTVDVYDWVIPDVLEHEERFVMTGGEGDGKSTLIRQFGLKSAAGIHPTTDEPMLPIRVLHVDLENGARRERRELGKMANLLAPDQLEAARGNFYIRTLPEGFDLSDGADQERLATWCEEVQPDLLLIGPRYKMLANEDDPSQAQAVMRFLDRVRAGYGCAIGTESHSPHKNSETGQRVTREYGTSKWLRWPEFGMHIARDGNVSHFRGPREPGRLWPGTWLRNENGWEHGKGWPWVPMQPGVVKISMTTDSDSELYGVVPVLRVVEGNEGVGQKALEKLLVDQHGGNAEGWRDQIERARTGALIDHQVEGVHITDAPGRGKRARYIVTKSGAVLLEESTEN